MNNRWEAPNAEPSLDEVLEDPIVRLLMEGDHTGESEVRQLIERVRTSWAHPDDDDPTETSARKARSKGSTRAA